MESVNAKDRHGHTPLIAAAKEGQKDFVMDLLHRGADLTSTSAKGKTALHYAAANGHSEIAEMLSDRELRERGIKVGAICGASNEASAIIAAAAAVR